MRGQAFLKTASGVVVAAGTSFEGVLTRGTSSGEASSLPLGNYAVLFEMVASSPGGWINESEECTVSGTEISCHETEPVRLRPPAPAPGEKLGPENPGSKSQHPCLKGDPIDCATGNLTETQSDLSVGGRGPGLDATRSYNSLGAAEATEPGAFGFGWTGPYSAHLQVNGETETATVVQDNASSVVFILNATTKTYEAPAWIQATLTKEGTNWIYTLPSQTKLEFNSEGRLVKETDRNGNAITLAYDGEHRLETATDGAGRKLTFVYNAAGEVESITDPMGHAATYTYASGNLASVTLPGESSPRWRFEYNASHLLTAMTDGRGHTTKNEYNASNQVSVQTDPQSRKRELAYAALESGTETTITEPNGSKTIEIFNAAGLPTKITRAAGTGIASSTEDEYDSAFNLTAVTDPNKHTTKYTYNGTGDRTSETDANGDETKWTYDTTHDVETTTTPKGETTTIKRNAAGDPEVIERPAPEAKTQKTKYKYDAQGDLTSVTNALEHAWSYEYDGDGDRTSGTDPEGDKRTWTYNQDSQQTAMVSPKGSVSGGHPANFTTTIRRDAQGRAVKVTEPEPAAQGRPEDVTPPAISGVVQEGKVLTTATGLWEGAAPLSYSYQWERCSAAGLECAAISGATGETYTPVTADGGHTLVLSVKASNGHGSATVLSAASGQVAVSSAVLPSGPVFQSEFGSEGSGSGQFVHPNGVAVDRHGNVWVVDSENARVEEFNKKEEFQKAFGSLGSGNGQLRIPLGLAVDRKGDVWVADSGNSRVEEFNEKGEFVQVFGSKGSGTGQFAEYGPTGVAVDSHGNVWVSDTHNGRLEEFNEKGEYQKSVGSKGTGAGQLEAPMGVAVGAGGNVWVADYANDRVTEFNEAGEFVRDFGSQGRASGQLESPYAIAVDDAGNVWVGDTYNERIDEFSEKGEYLTRFGTNVVSGEIGPGFYEPDQFGLYPGYGIAADPKGDIWLSDPTNNRIEKWQIPAHAIYQSEFGSEGSGSGQFVHPNGVAADAHGNVWVVDSENSRVEEFNEKEEFQKAFGSPGSGNGQLHIPLGVAVDGKGDVWVADSGNSRVEEFNEKGEFVQVFGSKGSGAGQFAEFGPAGIAVDSHGNVWVADTHGSRLEEFNEKGEYQKSVGSKGTGAGQLEAPMGVAVALGGNVWVADYVNDRVTEFNETGEFVREFGSEGRASGQLESPYAIAVDVDGNVWVGDTYNERIDEFNEKGEYLSRFGINVVSGEIGPGFYEADQFGLYPGYGVAVDLKGDVWLSDPTNNRIEKWPLSGSLANTARPTISGELVSGQTLTAGSGTWSATPTPTYSYQWQHCVPPAGGCSNISGATGTTHVVGSGDIGDELRLVVTATSSAGSASIASATTETVLEGPLQPRATNYSYDANGNVETVTEPNGNRTQYTYDADNEPIKVEAPNGAVTETEYDKAGQVTAQTDANKHTTKYVRSLLEEVTEVADPLGHKTKKEYDAAGNLKTLKDPKARTTTYTYDPGNRLTEVSYSDGKTPTVKYEYDKDGDRTAMTDGTGTSTYTYDQLDRLTESEDGHKDKTKYEYDLANEKIKITYPNGKAVSRAFDKAGRLEKVTDWNEHATKFSYDRDSNLTATTFPAESKDEDTYAYNNADQMTETKMLKSTETLASLVYGRDANGQLTKTTSTGLPGSESTEYTYDTNSRLTKAGSTAYEYDPANNPTKLGSGTYKYNAGSQLETGPSLTYTYDELGERTKTKPSTGPATTYGYDQAGNMISVERAKEGETTEIKDTYAYDGNGLRASQTISGTTTNMVWDMSEALPVLLNDGTNNYIYGPGDLPIEQLSSGGVTTYLHHDQQGSTRLLTGSTGTVTGSTTFDAYGNKTGSTGTATTPLGYDAEYTSADTGLIYLRARSYDPATAQFLTVDPISPISRAPYSYAGDDPLTLGDPTGLIFGIPGTPSIGQVGQFIGEQWRPVVSATLNVATITGCVVPLTAGGCGAYIAANALAQSALIATGPGSFEKRAALVAANLVLAGGASLAASQSELIGNLVELNPAYAPPPWVAPYLAGSAALPSLTLTGVELAAALDCPGT